MVGVAVTVEVTSSSALPMLLHRSVTLLNHPFARSKFRYPPTGMGGGSKIASVAGAVKDELV